MSTRRSTWKPVRQTDIGLAAAAAVAGISALCVAVVGAVLLLAR